MFLILDDEEIVRQVLKNCPVYEDNPTSVKEKIKLFEELKNLIEKGKIAHIIPNFK